MAAFQLISRFTGRGYRYGEISGLDLDTAPGLRAGSPG